MLEQQAVQKFQSRKMTVILAQLLFMVPKKDSDQRMIIINVLQVRTL